MIYAIDFDGTITNEAGDPYDSSTWVELDKKTVNEKVRMFMVNLLLEDEPTIVVYTARDWSDYYPIYRWLRDKRVPFNYLVCGKLKADVYLDDRAMKLEDIEE